MKSFTTKQFHEIQQDLIRLNKIKTLREISQEEFGGKVSYGVIGRAIKGIEPKSQRIRRNLGIQEPELIPQYRNPAGQFEKR